MAILKFQLLSGRAGFNNAVSRAAFRCVQSKPFEALVLAAILLNTLVPCEP